MHSPCSLNNDVEWQTLKNTLQQAANEAIGKRKKRRHKMRLILWNEDIKNLIENYDVEFKLANFLQLIGTIKRTIFKKVRTETIFKI